VAGKIVLCFGSEVVDGDDAAFRVCETLSGKIPGIVFKKCESPMDVLDFAGKEELVILDAVRGLGNVRVFDSADEFKKVKSLTAHDMDIGNTLMILKEMGMLGKVKVIGIPAASDPIKSVKEVRKILSSQLQVQEMG